MLRSRSRFEEHNIISRSLDTRSSHASCSAAATLSLDSSPSYWQVRWTTFTYWSVYCFCHHQLHWIAVSELLLLLLPLLLHPFNSLFSRTTWVSRYQKGKTSLDINEARDDGVLGCSGISWTICKQYAPRSRQINTPTPHQSIFTGRMLFLTLSRQCQSTEGTSTEGTYSLKTDHITTGSFQSLLLSLDWL